MKTLTSSRPDRLVRTAAWFYLAPRLVVVVLIVGAIALAALMIVATLARTWLLGRGA